MSKAIQVGDIIPASLLDGEEADGECAGLLSGYRLRGVGLRPMRSVYPAKELTAACGDADTCWAAEVIAVPFR